MSGRIPLLSAGRANESYDAVHDAQSDNKIEEGSQALNIAFEDVSTDRRQLRVARVSVWNGALFSVLLVAGILLLGGSLTPEGTEKTTAISADKLSAIQSDGETSVSVKSVAGYRDDPDIVVKSENVYTQLGALLTKHKDAIVSKKDSCLNSTKFGACLDVAEFAKIAEKELNESCWFSDAVSYHDEAKSAGGYTLFSAVRTEVHEEGAKPVYEGLQWTYLVAADGRLAHSWYTPDYPVQKFARLLENGNLNYMAFGGDPFAAYPDYGKYIIERSWEGHVEKKCQIGYSQISQDGVITGIMGHHDFVKTKKGTYIALMWRLETVEFCLNDLGLDPKGLGGQMTSRSKIPGCLNDGIQEFKFKEGSDDECEVVWEWWMSDHMIQDIKEDSPTYGVVKEHPELIDGNAMEWPQIDKFANAQIAHLNSMDYNEELDQVLMQSYDRGEVYIIDHSTTTKEAASHKGGKHGMGGDILYRVGNPRNYRRSEYQGEKDRVGYMYYMAHSAAWIAPGLPGAGDVLLFQNGNFMPGKIMPFGQPYASVTQIKTAFNPSLPSPPASSPPAATPPATFSISSPPLTASPQPSASSTTAASSHPAASPPTTTASPPAVPPVKNSTGAPEQLHSGFPWRRLLADSDYDYDYHGDYDYDSDKMKAKAEKKKRKAERKAERKAKKEKGQEGEEKHEEGGQQKHADNTPSAPKMQVDDKSPSQTCDMCITGGAFPEGNTKLGKPGRYNYDAIVDTDLTFGGQKIWQWNGIYQPHSGRFGGAQRLKNGSPPCPCASGAGPP
ncbi:hypothetical protein CYMTET_31716 [Cymbomonas tetramitiformis]|uniref:Uncharacterized protein n=1 Tax=Cymbomonas tetramitiformis TaxID=36881 RepID=A0AAE0KSY7_9CHLO|nr:hypothetical protein CYMTET_31716 [Cymbomonas tetramitiformis]